MSPAHWTTPAAGATSAPAAFVSAGVLYSHGRLRDNRGMIQKVVKIRPLKDRSAEREDIEYWLSRPPGERMEEIEDLRKSFYGDLHRLQRVVRVTQRKKG